MKHISIIGVGACGSAAFIEFVIQVLSLNIQDKVSITLIERNKKMGYGLAFGTKEKSHLLNTQADLMGIYAHEPHHFVSWLEEKKKQNITEIDNKSINSIHTSRILYGDYIAEQLNKYLKKAASKKLKITQLYKEAIDINKTGNSYTIKLENKKEVYADYIILAPGTPKPNNYNKFKTLESYIDFPWPNKRLKNKITKNDTVGILGTSLSAIDTVMTLIKNRHQGKILLFSPDGLLPRVQPKENKTIERDFLTLENIHKLRREIFNRPSAKDLLRLFQKEIENHQQQKIDWKSLNRKDKSTYTLLKEDIQIAENGGDALLNLAYSLRYDESTIWSWMSAHEKALFKKWLGRYWAINRHAMPLQNAVKLTTLFEQNRLQVIAGQEDVSYHKKAAAFIVNTSQKKYKVDKLINATGSATALEEMNNTLIANLLNKKYITPYSLGGALINQRTMQVVSKNGGNNIFAVGHLVNGLFIDVNAVWFNVKTISTLVREIVFKIRKDEYIS